MSKTKRLNSINKLREPSVSQGLVSLLLSIDGSFALYAEEQKKMTNQPNKPLQQRRGKSSAPANVYDRGGKRESILHQVLRVEENNRKLKEQSASMESQPKKEISNDDLLWLG